MTNKELNDLWIRQKELREELAKVNLKASIEMANDLNQDISFTEKQLCDAELEIARLKYENKIMRLQVSNVRTISERYRMTIKCIEKVLIDPDFNPCKINADGKKEFRAWNIYNGIKRLQDTVAALTGVTKPKELPAQSTEEISKEWSDFNASRKSSTTGK